MGALAGVMTPIVMRRLMKEQMDIGAGVVIVEGVGWGTVTGVLTPQETV